MSHVREVISKTYTSRTEKHRTCMYFLKIASPRPSYRVSLSWLYHLDVFMHRNVCMTVCVFASVSIRRFHVCRLSLYRLCVYRLVCVCVSDGSECPCVCVKVCLLSVCVCCAASLCLCVSMRVHTCRCVCIYVGDVCHIVYRREILCSATCSSCSC